MIEQIDLNCGPTLSSGPISISCNTGLTVFVGPNNCGKSALLETINHFISSGNVNGSKASACKSIKMGAFDEKYLSQHPDFKNADYSKKIADFGGPRTKEQWDEFFYSGWKSHHLMNQFRASLCLSMNGSTRLSMLPREQRVSLRKPTGRMARLFANDADRKFFQDAVFAGISTYPVIDHVSRLGDLNLAFSSMEPDAQVERKLDDKTIHYFNRSYSIDQASDGYKAYVGMLGALMSGDFATILIDEPEAFLHPALARTLGNQIARQAKDKQVFVATHSGDFLMGAIEAGANVQIVRLQYQSGKGTARILSRSDLKSFMNDPLLRSSNVLSGLFAQSVVVTEADTDRAFYQEINTRLLSAKDPRGIENCVFLNAQNKQTVPRIVKMLRQVGVPTAGIVDLDVLEDGGKDWTRQLTAAGIPEASHQGYGSQRKAILEALRKFGDDKAYKTGGGIDVLESGIKNAAEDLLKTLQSYGLFVVSIGEVEGWLAHLNISKSKHTWLHKVFEKMGADPAHADFVTPQKGDVWDFLGALNDWFSTPERRGMD